MIGKNPTKIPRARPLPGTPPGTLERRSSLLAARPWRELYRTRDDYRLTYVGLLLQPRRSP